MFLDWTSLFFPPTANICGAECAKSGPIVGTHPVIREASMCGNAEAAIIISDYMLWIGEVYTPLFTFFVI